MTAVEYLEQYRTVSAYVEQLDKLIDRMGKEIFSGPSDRITAHMSNSIGRSENQNYWGAKDIAEFRHLLGEQKEQKRVLRQFMKTVITQIISMEDEQDIVILLGRFVNFETWGDIAKSLGYSESYVRGYRKDIAINHFTVKFASAFYKVSTNSTDNTNLSTHNTLLT